MDSMDSEHSAITRDHTRTLTESEWLSMKTTIARLVEKANVSNVEFVADQILTENILIGRGLFCQTIIKSQSESPQLTNVYAALAAIINTKSPQVGHLLVKRSVLHFRAAHGRGDKKQMQNASRFLAQLVNQRVVYESLALNVLMLLLVNPCSDNVEVAVSFCWQCGALLLNVVPLKLKEIVGEFRSLLRKGVVEKRTQVLIVRLLAAYRLKFRESAGAIHALEAVDDEDQVTHHVSLLQEIDSETSLDRFHTKSDVFEEEDEAEVSSKAPSDQIAKTFVHPN